MSSSFSTLAKVATLFLSRYKCPGPPCESLRLGGWDCTLGVSNHCSPNTCRRKRARPWRWHPPPLPHSQAGRAEPYLAENQHLPDFGPLVVDIQLLLYLLWGGRGVSAAPTICVLPHSSPETRRQRGQRAHTQNVLEGRVLVVLGETRPQVRAPLGQYPPPDQRWGWGHSRRGWG